MPHYLLISSDKEEAIRYFRWRKESAPELNLSVITRHRYASIYNGFADQVYGVDDLSDITGVCNQVLDACRYSSLDAVITPTEKSVLPGGFIRSFFSIRGPQFETTLWLTNKIAMKMRLKENNIPIANFESIYHMKDIPRVSEMLGWPLVIKPAMGTGRRGMRLISSRAHYEELKASSLLDGVGVDVPWIAEQYIDMEEYHCDALVQDKKVIYTSVSKYFQPLHQVHSELEGSYILSKGNKISTDIEELLTEVVAVMQIQDGPVHMEVFHTRTGDLLVGEVALRVGGAGISGTILRKNGVNLWESSFQIAIHEKVRFTAVNHTAGVFGWISIPCREGVLQNYMLLDDLKEIPEVIDVDVHFELGDLVERKQGSDFVLATIYFRLEREEELLQVLDKIRSTYVADFS